MEQPLPASGICLGSAVGEPRRRHSGECVQNPQGCLSAKVSSGEGGNSAIGSGLSSSAEAFARLHLVHLFESSALKMAGFGRKRSLSGAAPWPRNRTWCSVVPRGAWAGRSWWAVLRPRHWARSSLCRRHSASAGAVTSSPCSSTRSE